ncbi:MAG TPA: CapA family protein [Actinomycetes bacterium]|nr:CapA family protein [Actinomycetes bacterium]
MPDPRARLLAAAAAAAAAALLAASCGGTTRPAGTGLPVPGAGRGPAAAPAPVTLAFGGDVHFEGVLAAQLEQDPQSALEPVAALLRGADLAMVNLETAITERGTAADKEFTFRAPPAAFAALKAAGVDVVTMANNHGMDYGVQGLRDSLDAAHAARFPVVGAGLDAERAFAPYHLEVRGLRVAVLGATQVLDDALAAAWTAGDGKPGLASARDEERLTAAVRAARRGADTVVVFLHWGSEGVACPTGGQRDLARALVAAGADVIVGSHAHVLLGGGGLDGAYVDYGLGNLVFSSLPGPGSRTGVLELAVRGRDVLRARWRPAEISGGLPHPLSGGARQAAAAAWEGLRPCTGLTGRG